LSFEVEASERYVKGQLTGDEHIALIQAAVLGLIPQAIAPRPQPHARFAGVNQVSTE